MLEKYDKDIKKLKKWYTQAKEIVIRAESLDPENKAYIQPLHEQRYCLDHLLRAIQYDEDNSGEEKIKKSIELAIGHLQRAYSDSIEWIYVSIKEVYIDTLAEYTTEQIQYAIPEYYSEIKPQMCRIEEIINKYKIGKSIEETIHPEILSDDELEQLNKATKEYLENNVVEKMTNYLYLLYEREESLIEIKYKDKKKVRKEIVIKDITIPLALLVIGVVLGMLIK